MPIIGSNPIAPSPVQDDIAIDWQARNEAARARWVMEHGAEQLCPNCSGHPIIDHPENACILNRADRHHPRGKRGAGRLRRVV